MKSVQIRNCFCSVFSPNAGKYRPEVTPYLNSSRSGEVQQRGTTPIIIKAALTDLLFGAILREKH